MTEKRFTYLDASRNKYIGSFFCNGVPLTNDEVVDLLNENEQLKQRNDRQAKQLAELYELMAKKDWESLTEIIDDFKRCEEQLQRESGTYW